MNVFKTYLAEIRSNPKIYTFKLSFFSIAYFVLLFPYLAEYVNTPSTVVYDIPLISAGNPPATIIMCSDVSDVMDVIDVKLTPDPPAKGSNLTVEISGNLKTDLNEGLYMMATVQKGGIKFPQFKMSACEYLDSGCPIEKGFTTLSMTFEIPKMIPGGNYDIQTSLFNTPSKKRKSDFSLEEKFEIVKNLFLYSRLPQSRITEEDSRVLCLQGSIQF